MDTLILNDLKLEIPSGRKLRIEKVQWSTQKEPCQSCHEKADVSVTVISLTEKESWEELSPYEYDTRKEKIDLCYPCLKRLNSEFTWRPVTTYDDSHPWKVPI